MSELAEAIILSAALAGRSTAAELDTLPENERWVDANFLGDVLTGRHGPISPGGFILQRAEVRGTLNLSNSKLVGPLWIRDSFFTDRPNLSSCHAEKVTFERCKLPGLLATNLRTNFVGLEDCDIDGCVFLVEARIAGQLNASGVRILGDGKVCLWLFGARVDGAVILWDSGESGRHASFKNGSVVLIDARVGSQFNASGATFSFHDEVDDRTLRREALVVATTHVSGWMFLDRVVCTGGAMLMGLKVDGSLRATGAKFSAQGARESIRLSGAELGGDLILADGFVARGRVQANGMVVGGSIVLSGGTFVRSHPPVDRDARSEWDDVALGFDGISARGIFGRGAGKSAFRSLGRFRLFGANIAGPIRLEGARMQRTGGDALDVSRSEVGNNVRIETADVKGTIQCWGSVLHGYLSVNGIIRSPGRPMLVLRGTTVDQEVVLGSEKHTLGPGELRMDHVILGGTLNAHNVDSLSRINLHGARTRDLHLPMLDGQADLDGAEFDSLVINNQGESATLLKTQIAFLAVQPYQPSVYSRLAALADSEGNRGGATHLRVASERHRWSDRGRGWRRVGGILDWTTGFGFRPLRILLGTFVMIVLSTAFLAGWSRPRQFLVHVDKAGVVHLAAARPKSNLLPEAVDAPCGADFPCFSAPAFVLDTFVPLVNLGQRDAWRPIQRGRTGWLLQVGLWGMTLTGWGLATMLAAGFSRLSREK